MKTIRKTKEPGFLHLSNIGALESMYERYQQEPSSVSEEWRQLFSQFNLPVGEERFARAGLSAREAEALLKHEAIGTLIQTLRAEGERFAGTNPLTPYLTAQAESVPALPNHLTPEFYGLEKEDLKETFVHQSPVMPAGATLGQALAMLTRVYTGPVGFEIMHLEDEQRRWLFEQIETSLPFARANQEGKKRILRLLTMAEGLERFLQTRYVGQKRFSLEGGETLIPMLDHLIASASAAGVRELVIGMAHRGRLNVLVNIMGKPVADLCQEFAGKHTENHDILSGDVKYHQGYNSEVSTASGVMHLSLAFNPSHLEVVSPVVDGSARARQDRRGQQGQEEVLPLLIHGDASFSGQGVVMETLNMSQTRGYNTGGTIHIVHNNQIGFTTSAPEDSRSTRYCTDIARMIGAPVFHVNGDAPEEALATIELALAYRNRFHRDVIIDLICFRKLGHNETDEPAVTQPLMYAAVARHPGSRSLYAEALARVGLVTAEEADEMIIAYKHALEEGGRVNEPMPGTNDSTEPGQDPSLFAPFLNGRWSDYTSTAFPLAELKRLGTALTTTPLGFALHPRLEKLLGDRRRMTSGDAPVDWGMAELLAYATLLNQGHGLRISGQDSGRGTFAHRHAILHDQQGNGSFSPLAQIVQPGKTLAIIDSLLSEEAVLGFEYGYAASEPRSLIIWEAQFGDFANGAQVIIDQFISSSEAKWGRLSGLVMLLPHGFEGQGPEHSSARLERYLQLCAQDNIQVCIPSTPAQIYHLLRRQMLRRFRKPLIVLTPKSLLRHKGAVSSLEELASGCFQPVIGDSDCLPEQVNRVVLAAGKVYYDLAEARHAAALSHVAIVRMEQFYPFPEEQLLTELARFKNATEFVLAQEEPENQGSYYYLERQLRRIMPGRIFAYAGREASAAPACGHMPEHNMQQQELIVQALTGLIQ